MQSIGNVILDDYVSNVQRTGVNAPPVRAPSPGRPNVFQKTWEDHHNGNCSQANFPVTLKLSDIIEGYRTLLRDLPELDNMVFGGNRRSYDTMHDDISRDYEEDYDDEAKGGADNYDPEDP